MRKQPRLFWKQEQNYQNQNHKMKQLMKEETILIQKAKFKSTYLINVLRKNMRRCYSHEIRIN